MYSNNIKLIAFLLLKFEIFPSICIEIYYGSRAFKSMKEEMYFKQKKKESFTNCSVTKFKIEKKARSSQLRTQKSRNQKPKIISILSSPSVNNSNDSPLPSTKNYQDYSTNYINYNFYQETTKIEKNLPVDFSTNKSVPLKRVDILPFDKTPSYNTSPPRLEDYQKEMISKYCTAENIHYDLYSVTSTLNNNLIPNTNNPSSQLEMSVRNIMNSFNSDSNIDLCLSISLPKAKKKKQSSEDYHLTSILNLSQYDIAVPVISYAKESDNIIFYDY